MTPSTVAGLCDVAFTSACQNGGSPWHLGRFHPLFFEGWLTSKCCEMRKSKIWVCLKISYTHKYTYIYILKNYTGIDPR